MNETPKVKRSSLDALIDQNKEMREKLSKTENSLEDFRRIVACLVCQYGVKSLEDGKTRILIDEATQRMVSEKVSRTTRFGVSGRKGENVISISVDV